mgnify:CR=1 FL=1
MKCPHCKTHVSKIPVNFKCPQCGETLPEPGFWFNFFEYLTAYLSEKGFIFWAIVFLLFLLIVGGFELGLGQGLLLKYLGRHFLIAAVMILLTGELISHYMKIILPLRLPTGGSDFILRERAVIRRIRRGSHIAASIGLVISLVWIGPRGFFEHFPYYIFIIGWCLIMGWSIAGLYLDPRLIDDVRFRYFIDRLNITSLKKHRSRCVVMIIVLFSVAALYSVTVIVPGVLQNVHNWLIVGAVLDFIDNYLAWLL